LPIELVSAYKKISEGIRVEALSTMREYGYFDGARMNAKRGIVARPVGSRPEDGWVAALKQAGMQ
jgi:hypothetical protein